MTDGIRRAAEILEECVEEEVELEGGVSHYIEEYEELRLTLKSFLKKEVLDSILLLYKELSKEPREPEMYSWFVRNSQFGGECRFALQALRKFKEKRLDRMEELLERCLESTEKLKKES